MKLIICLRTVLIVLIISISVKIDSQASFSSTFKIKYGWLFVFDSSNMKNIIGTIYDQLINRIGPLRTPV